MQQKGSFHCCHVFTAKGIILISWEGGDGSAQHGQSVIYDCLVSSMYLSMTENCLMFCRFRLGMTEACRQKLLIQAKQDNSN